MFEKKVFGEGGKVGIQDRITFGELSKATTATVERVMRELGIRYWQRSEPAYIIWLQFSRRYSFPLKQLIHIVITEYRKRLKKSGPGLSISIHILTGRKAMFWLGEHLKREFPHNTAGPTLNQLQRLKTTTGSRDYQDQVEYIRQHPSKSVTGGKAFRGSPRWQLPVDRFSKDSVLLALNLEPPREKRKRFNISEEIE